MDKIRVTKTPEVTLVDAALTCGHEHSREIGSSLWDFPDEPVWCPICMEERQLDLEVQLFLSIVPL